jgi:hypothetical protein
MTGKQATVKKPVYLPVPPSQSKSQTETHTSNTSNTNRLVKVEDIPPSLSIPFAASATATATVASPVDFQSEESTGSLKGGSPRPDRISLLREKIQSHPRPKKTRGGKTLWNVIVISGEKRHAEIETIAL